MEIAIILFRQVKDTEGHPGGGQIMGWYWIEQWHWVVESIRIYTHYNIDTAGEVILWG